MMFSPQILEGEHVRLEPLRPDHREGLSAAIRDGELWRLFFTSVPHPDDIDQFIPRAIGDEKSGDGLSFVSIDTSSGTIAGSTRFMKASAADRRVEIGHTFLGQSCQRTAINTEAKLLMLTHAFEQLHMQRVEFLTDSLNHKSRQAIARLGAKEEGVLRRHRIMANGRVRDSVIFSIVDNEWSGVKQTLQHYLSRTN